jgi:hypothetical protein
MPDVSVNENLGEMTVTQSGSSVTIETRSPPGVAPLSCSYPGTYTQNGRMGSISGTYTCSNGASGPFTLSEIQATRFAFAGRLSVSSGGCARQGHLGGVRSSAFADAS